MRYLWQWSSLGDQFGAADLLVDNFKAIGVSHVTANVDGVAPWSDHDGIAVLKLRGRDDSFQ